MNANSKYNTRYKELKQMLKATAKQEKANNGNDKGRTNFVLNDEADRHLRDLRRSDISDSKFKQIESWLSNYVCTLHA